ncbi:hypothetical protein V6R21_09390 [Limibacter armeniacum]|uniref:hypothetical protein n=1 Tax=Limibacter armeniacum TaxID=466084 RepID=UPI002FE57E67
MKTLLLWSLTLFLLSLFNVDCHAQRKSRNYLHLGLKFSSQGIGIDAEKTLKNHFSVSGNINYLNVNFTQNRYILDYSILAKIKAETITAGIYGHYYFHPETRNAPIALKVTAGLAYNVMTDFSVTGLNDSNVFVGGIDISPEELGQVAVFIKTNSIMPYLGIGSNLELKDIRSLRRQHWFILNDILKGLGLGIDIGAFYQGAPKVSMEASNYLAPNVSQQPTIEQNLSQYQIYPYLSFKLHYTFTLISLKLL